MTPRRVGWAAVLLGGGAQSAGWFVIVVTGSPACGAAVLLAGLLWGLRLAAD